MLRPRSQVAYSLAVLVGLSCLGCDDQAAPEPPPIPPATALVGEFTGFKQYSASGVLLTIITESVTDSVRGEWRMSYTISSSDDEGTFAGTYVDGYLRLQLRLNSTCSGGYALDGVAKTVAGDDWTFIIKPSGQCWHYATSPITISRGDDPYFPY